MKYKAHDYLISDRKLKEMAWLHFSQSEQLQDYGKVYENPTIEMVNWFRDKYNGWTMDWFWIHYGIMDVEYLEEHPKEANFFEVWLNTDEFILRHRFSDRLKQLEEYENRFYTKNTKNGNEIQKG